MANTSITSPNKKIRKNRNARPVWMYVGVTALFAIAFVFSLVIAARSVQDEYFARLARSANAATLATAGRAASDLAGIKASLDLLVDQVGRTELRFSGVSNGLNATLATTMRQPWVIGAEVREAGGGIIARLGAASAAFPPPSVLFDPNLAEDETIIHRPRPITSRLNAFALQHLTSDSAGRRVSIVLLVALEELRLSLPTDFSGDIGGMLLASTGGDILAAGGKPFADLRVADGAIFAALPESYRTQLPGEVRGYRAHIDATGPQRVFAYATVAGWPLYVVTASAPRIGWGISDLILARFLAIVTPVMGTLLMFLLFFSARWVGHRRRLARLGGKLRQSRAALRNVSVGTLVWQHGGDTVQISNSWKKMLGFSPDEVGDQLADWLNRIHKDDRHQAVQGLQAVIDGEIEVHRHIIRMMAKDGTSRPMSQAITALRGSPAEAPTIVLTQVAASLPVPNTTSAPSGFPQATKTEPTNTPRPGSKPHKVA